MAAAKKNNSKFLLLADIMHFEEERTKKTVEGFVDIRCLSVIIKAPFVVLFIDDCFVWKKAGGLPGQKHDPRPV